MPELHRIKSKQTALCPATRPLADAERRELRSIIRKAQWKRSTSEEYRDAPHEYIVWFQPRGCTQKEWKRFAELIRDCGEYRKWRGSHFKYLLLGNWAYWTMWPVLNRARRSTLMPDAGADVTTKKRYTRFQPHPKKYADNAERQRAYRERHRKPPSEKEKRESAQFKRLFRKFFAASGARVTTKGTTKKRKTAHG